MDAAPIPRGQGRVRQEAPRSRSTSHREWQPRYWKPPPLSPLTETFPPPFPPSSILKHPCVYVAPERGAQGSIRLAVHRRRRGDTPPWTPLLLLLDLARPKGPSWEKTTTTFTIGKIWWGHLW